MKRKGSRKEKYIIDSFGWIEYFIDGPLSEKYAYYIDKCRPDNCLTPSIILYEVYKIVKREKSEEKAIFAIVHIDHYSTIINPQSLPQNLLPRKKIIFQTSEFSILD